MIIVISLFLETRKQEVVINLSLAYQIYKLMIPLIDNPTVTKQIDF